MTLESTETLRQELAQWRDMDHQPRFWLRDDDAIEPSKALDTLLTIMGDAPVIIASIPAFATAGLAERLSLSENVSVVQHGWRHENNASQTEKKSEFPNSVPLATRLDALREGREQLAKVFGPQSRPVLVPPWNRAPDTLIPHLPSLGIGGLSRYRRTEFSDRETHPGVLQIDTQIDIIDWRGTRGLRPPEALYSEISDTLAAARRALHSGEKPGPIGILTHHLVHDPTCWRFLEELYSLIVLEGGIWINPFETKTGS